MCNIHTSSCETAATSEPGNICSTRTCKNAFRSGGGDARNPCGATDVPAQSVPASHEAQEENAEEDIYEYDCPRAAAPPPPTRRTLSDISGPSAAFGALSIDSLEAGMSPTPSHTRL